MMFFSNPRFVYVMAASLLTVTVFNTGEWVCAEEMSAMSLQTIKQKLVQAIEQQSRAVENISFDFQSEGYRFRDGQFVLDFTDNGYFHLGNGGERFYRRLDREKSRIPDNPIESLKQKVQVLKSSNQDYHVTENDEGVSFVARTDGEYTKEEIVASSNFSVLFGVAVLPTNDDGSAIPVMLSDFIQNPSISLEEDKNDVLGGKLLRATADYGGYRVDAWFDPSLNFALKKIRQETSRDAVIKQPDIIETKITEHELVAGVYLPKVLSMELYSSAGQVRLGDGEMVDSPATHDRIEVTLTNYLVDNKKEDFRIVGIADGTPVFVENISQIRYVWADGNVQPATDELLTRIAQGDHKFMPGPDEPRFWLMSIGIILILIGGGRMAYKYFKGETTL